MEVFIFKVKSGPIKKMHFTLPQITSITKINSTISLIGSLPNFNGNHRIGIFIGSTNGDIYYLQLLRIVPELSAVGIYA